MASFLPAYKLTAQSEGGYSNDPNDTGGETWKGIARNKHPNWEGWSIVDAHKSMSSNWEDVLHQDMQLEEDVLRFYEEKFWNKLNLSKISSQAIANEVYDTGVNQGTGMVGKQFQGALNLLNNNQNHYPDLHIDGGIGPKTLAAFNDYMDTAKFRSRTTERNERVFLKVLNGLQFARYKEIVENNEGQEVFFYGWVNNRIE